MNSLNLLSKSTSILLILGISIFFVIIGIIYSKKYRGLNNYLLANRSVETFSLTTSLVASALGAWILFGPASAASWGGIGAVIGYALGTAFPLFILIFIGEKFRKKYPKGKTLIEVVRLKYGPNLFKLILILSVFYMTIFLIAEITAVSMLIKYISGTDLWITALIVIVSCLVYTLYGGLRASLFTDKFQFIFLIFLLLITFSFLINFNSNEFSFNFVREKKPYLLSSNYLPNFTAGVTFFIAVAATNLFHQGNWQRVYAAKNNKVLKKTLSISSNIVSLPDLAFFQLLFKDQYIAISVIIVFLAISLTVSSIDTIINAISSLIIVDGKKILKFKNYNKLSKQIIFFLSIISLYVASKGFSILYLFLLADLFCCAAVISVFYGFYSNSFSEKNIFVSVIVGVIAGLFIFPSPDFSRSLLFGIIIINNNNFNNNYYCNSKYYYYYWHTLQ